MLKSFSHPMILCRILPTRVIFTLTHTCAHYKLQNYHFWNSPANNVCIDKRIIFLFRKFMLFIYFQFQIIFGKIVFCRMMCHNLVWPWRRHLTLSGWSFLYSCLYQTKTMLNTPLTFGHKHMSICICILMTICSWCIQLLYSVSIQLISALFKIRIHRFGNIFDSWWSSYLIIFQENFSLFKLASYHY